uniref:DNA-3-methyladenine glycosylase n=1 Tax=Eptatretus burgeri TaxID=7764 RepID=A0A8C4N2M8_EPTBU
MIEIREINVIGGRDMSSQSWARNRRLRSTPQDDEEPREGTAGGNSDGDSLATPMKSSKYFQAEDASGFRRLGRDFFDQPCVVLARALLGKVLTRRLPGGEILQGRVVETEAYLGGDDLASHSRGGRQTPRNSAMFMEPGTIYVYQIYGLYYCLNISSQGPGAAVLLRALEPLEGEETMQQLRTRAQKRAAAKATRPLKTRQLCGGPAKLCQAFALNKTFDKKDLASDTELWVEENRYSQPQTKHDVESKNVVCTSRIGVASAAEWAQKPLRFYIYGNPCVSVIDRKVQG